MGATKLIKESIVFGSCHYCKKEVVAKNFGTVHASQFKKKQFVVCSSKGCVGRLKSFRSRLARVRENSLFAQGVEA